MQGRQISPFNAYPHDVGQVYILIHKALNLLSETWLQSPHWDHEPSEEELAREREYEDRAEEARQELQHTAEDVYVWLVGHKPPTLEEIKAKREKSRDDILRENGWLIHCYSPFEISKADGSFASQEAAELVVAYLRENGSDEA